MKRLYLLFVTLAVSACGSAERISCQPPLTGDVAYIVGQGWHAEIGIPVEELDDNMAYFREVFPNARVIMFSYGKKTFFIAPAATLSEYVLGPFPGAAVIQVVGLSVSPTTAYPPENTVTLRLPPNGGQSLSAYIWKELVKDGSNKPQIVARSTEPTGLFYSARSEYNLLHTCNTWVADALHNAGLPISGDNVVFSNQVMTRVIDVAGEQCQALR
ncbi:MAG: DUF2459 domain-containing protein [Methylomonas sp.]|jgi:hypothetical protein